MMNIAAPAPQQARIRPRLDFLGTAAPRAGLLVLFALATAWMAAPAHAQTRPGKQATPPMVREIDQRIAELSARLEAQEEEALVLSEALEQGGEAFRRNTERLEELEKEWTAIREALDAHVKMAEKLQAVMREREQGLKALLEWQTLKRDVLTAASGEKPAARK